VEEFKFLILAKSNSVKSSDHPDASDRHNRETFEGNFETIERKALISSFFQRLPDGLNQEKLQMREIGVDDIGNCKLNLIENPMINIPDFVWVQGAGEHGEIQA